MSGLHIVFFLLVLSSWLQCQTVVSARQLMEDLGCGNCHEGISTSLKVKDRAPSLNNAGARYNPAYLFHYLQDPSRIRQHIGSSIMPDFNFDERESLALTLFLEQLKDSLSLPQSLLFSTFPKLEKRDLNGHSVMMIDLDCIRCHSLEGKGKNTSIDLSTVGYRLESKWVQAYLIAPYLFDGPSTAMPSFFYRYDETKQSFQETLPHAKEIIQKITWYLFTLNVEKRHQFQVTYEKSKQANPDINAEMGKQIVLSQNCMACHELSSLTPTFAKNAPDLNVEWARVRKSWLDNYLKNPMPIRPFGYYPGSGSRMPDFELNEEQVRIISDYLMPEEESKSFYAQSQSEFSKNKAQSLLKHKLSCLGCHMLGDEGGRIGPALLNVSERLKPSFVYNIIKNPRKILAYTVMPEIPIDSSTLELVVNYLLHQEEQAYDSSYLSLIDNPITFFDHNDEVKSNYLKYCAPCHGDQGDGHGYNAKFLAAQPTTLADKKSMSARPDDTLFDGIYSGGYILNKSHLMPPWGKTLSDIEIWQLVEFIRDMCQCQGPAWSRDNQ